MSELTRLCAVAGLSEADTARLISLESELPLIADLTNADVFLDLRAPGEDAALVAAHARPAQGVSAYDTSVLGQYALPADEPAVFHAFDLGVPVCDLKAITQEGRSVRQNVAPVRGEGGAVIAVLIREKDVSEELRREEKFEALARSYEESGPAAVAPSGDSLLLREMHHRVKNNLQLVASILNLQAHRIQEPAIRTLFQENVNRVLSIAAIHDILTNTTTGDMRRLSARELFARLAQNLSALIPPEKELRLSMTADDLSLTADTATSLSLVITELVTNAFSHAFEGRASGAVAVELRRGEFLHTVSVSDDGTGFDPARGESLGLRIVRSTVHDKLGGVLHVSSDSRGTRVSFDFKN